MYFVPWLESHARMKYQGFIDRVLDVCDPEAGGFDVRYLVSELNGVGAAPTETLTMQAWAKRELRTRVVGVHTDARRKESAFGTIKLLLQQGRLVLPRHPELLRQLASLQFEERESGQTRIAVPENLGHDDLALALAQAVSAIKPSVTGYRYDPDEPISSCGEELETAGGTSIRERPHCWQGWSCFRSPAGGATDDGW